MSTVLIVDDEPSVRRILDRMVTDAGYVTAEAESAEAALAAMANEPAGVVFCDIQMPGKGGLWLAAELRRHYPTSAIILATGISDVPPATSMQYGITSYLVKPFSAEEVKDALEAAMKWHTETTASGPKPEDAVDKIQDWLDSFEN
jgi:hypothetical protein